MAETPFETSVFVSYSRKDRRAVDLLVPILQANGFNVFIDRNDIAPAEVFRERIAQLILSADVVVFVLSPDAVRSQMCVWEVEQTLALGKKLVPLLYRAVQARDCPAGLAERNWVASEEEWIDGGLSHAATQALLAAINVDIEWERNRTLWVSRAVRWSQAGKPAGQLLRAEEIGVIEAWAARRPSNAAALSEDLLAFLSASTAREQADRDRFRSITGRAFVMPIAEALRGHEPDRALRMLAMAMVLADDPEFNIVPQLWREGARCLLRKPLCSVMDKLAKVATDRFRDDTSLYAVSPDATRAALHDVANSVTFFDMTNGQVLWSVPIGTEPHELHVTEGFGVIAVSPEGDIVRLAESDGTVVARVHLRRKGSRELTAVVPERKCLLAAAGPVLFSYDFDSNRIQELRTFDAHILSFDYCAARDKGIVILLSDGGWVAETFGACPSRRYQLENESDISYACFSKDGSTLCIADTGHAMVYDSDAEQPRIRVQHAGKVSSTGYDLDTVNLSDDGALLLTGSHDGTARVWDTKSGQELHRLDHVNEALITVAAFGPGCRSVITVGTDCSVRVWSLQTSEDIFRVDDRHNGWSAGWNNLGILGAGLSRDGSRVWIQTHGGLAQVWPCTAWAELPLPAPKRAPRHGYDIRDLRALPRQRLGVLNLEGLFRVFDIDTGAVTHERSLGEKTEDVLVLEEHDMLVAVKHDRTICVPLFHGGTHWRRKHSERVHTMTHIPPTGMLAIGGGAYGSGSGFIEFVDLRGQPVASAAMRGWTCATAWHPQRSTILVGDVSGSLQEWSADAGRIVHVFDLFHSKIEAIAIPPDGGHFYVAADDWVWRVSADNLGKEQIFALNGSVSSLACDATGTVLFIAGVSVARFIDPRRGALLLAAHPTEYDGNEPEEFTHFVVTDDWSAFIGVTSKGRWLRRSLSDLIGSVASPAGAIAAALENGNDARRASERIDVLMSEQPDDLLTRVKALAAR